MTATADSNLNVRWLGTVDYQECWDLQRALYRRRHNHLLLCEHRPVFTLGRSGDEVNLLVDPAEVGAALHRVDRGGDITFHGPGQLVGYPVVSLPGKRGGTMADTVAYVTAVEQLIIDVVAELGLEASRIRGCPGVWVDVDRPQPLKLAAIGVKVSQTRTMHGFALNVDTDLAWFERIVPCGLNDKGVTSLRAQGVEATMADVVDLVTAHAPGLLTPGRAVDRQDVAWRHRRSDLAPFSRRAANADADADAVNVDAVNVDAVNVDGVGEGLAGVPVRLGRRLAEAGVAEHLPITERKPPWMRVEVRTDPGYLKLKKLSRSLQLTTVCEEARCPNIYECWNEGTATFMLLGERCTRACGFCLIDTTRPQPPDAAEPQRVAEAVQRLDLDYAVLTMVARDDLDDGGADIVARTVEAIHHNNPAVGVEVLISDLAGSAAALDRICRAEPQIVNHNMETVPRLQRAVRPSAAYARSLTVLARASAAGRTTKSGIIVGMGERADEVRSTLVDLAAVGVEIVTIGQYLRPSAEHLPLHRWWTPDELGELKAFGENELGFARVEASPLTRSSHHAASAAAVVSR